MQITRRQLLIAASVAIYAGSGLDSRKRVDRALAGKDTDRPPFSAWHHFGLEKQGPEVFAQATVRFHQETGTDLVKVMSDFPYPKGSGDLSSLRIKSNPFPAQIRALELIRGSIGSQNYFLETIFNPWSVAEHLSSKQHLFEWKAAQPQKLIDALEVIARSEANHARLALRTGAHGVFLAIQNASPDVLSEADYAKFSEPFDKLVLSAASGAPLNVLHLHGSNIYWPRFTRGWAAAEINYSSTATRVPISEVRARYAGLIFGGIDEDNFPKLSSADLRQQALHARQEAGKHFILTPGCSVPNNTSTESVRRLGSVYA